MQRNPLIKQKTRVTFYNPDNKSDHKEETMLS